MLGQPLGDTHIAMPSIINPLFQRFAFEYTFIMISDSGSDCQSGQAPLNREEGNPNRLPLKSEKAALGQASRGVSTELKQAASLFFFSFLIKVTIKAVLCPLYKPSG